MRSNSYFIKEYKYSMRGYGQLTGNYMKLWDGDNAYYFFKEISKSMYNCFVHGNRDVITTIVWKGVSYEYVNPQDILEGVFVYRTQNGRQRSIDLKGYISYIERRKSA